MVGAKIKQYLNDKGIKQSFLAEKTGMTNSVISDICNSNRKIDCMEYYRICKALDVSLDFFVEGIEV